MKRHVLALTILCAVGIAMLVLWTTVRRVSLNKSDAIEIENEFTAEVYDLVVGNDASIWALGDSLLARFHAGQWTTSTTNYPFREIETAPDGTLWACADTVVAELDGTQWISRTPPLEPSIYRFRSLHVDSRGSPWVAAVGNGSETLLRFDGLQWNRLPQPDIFPDEPGLEKLFGFVGVDDNGRPMITVWHGTYYFEHGRWVHSGEKIADAIFLPDGSRWAMLWGSKPVIGRIGFNWSYVIVGICFQPESGNQKCYLNGEPPSEPGDLGTSAFAGEQTEMLATEVLADRRIRSFTVTPNGVLYAIADNYLVCFDGENWLARDTQQINREIQRIRSASDGSIWAITERGVGQITWPGDSCAR